MIHEILVVSGRNIPSFPESNCHVCADNSLEITCIYMGNSGTCSLFVCKLPAKVAK